MDFADCGSPRLAYDQGELEILSPLAEHEEITWAIERIVEAIAGASRIRFRNLRSTTFKRVDLERGFEADASFYFGQAAELVRGTREIELSVDPPPHLVVEVDLTLASLDKFPIYASLGVPEIWRFRGGRLEMLESVDGTYRSIERSVLLPVLTSDAATGWIASSRTSDAFEWTVQLRQWSLQLAGSASADEH
jgi:Uma2 family endonuclease